MSIFIPPRDRDAYSTIRGYVYQVDLTIERWINLQPGQILEIERGEDIDTIYRSLTATPEEQKRLLEQVKHREKSITLRSPEAIIALACAVEHRQNNSESNIVFQFTTNAKVGKERPSPIPDKTPAISVWEQICQGNLDDTAKKSLVQNIRSFLGSISQPNKLNQETWKLFCDFLNDSDEQEFLDFIHSFRWNIKAPEAKSLSSYIKKILIEQQYVKNELEAREQYQKLFLYVFKLLSQSGIKRLDVDQLSNQLSLQTLSLEDHSLLENVVVGLLSLESRVDNLEQNFQEFTQKFVLQANSQIQHQIKEKGVDYAPNLYPTIPDISLPLIKTSSLRKNTVKRLINYFDSHDWIAINGIIGSGKTSLVVLIAKEIGTCHAWVRLRNLDKNEALQEIDEALKGLNLSPQLSNTYQWYCQICQQLGQDALLVLDDLSELSGGDLLCERLIQLAKACSKFGVRLLSTSPYELPISLQEALDEKILYCTKTPPFEDSEAAEILHANGASIDILKSHTKFINSLAQQHPFLITVIARYLRKHNWQITDEVESKLFSKKYQGAIDTEMMRRVLDSVENENARELLYRLTLPIHSFSLNQVQAIASVNPVLSRPGELLHLLIGLWVQSEGDESLLVSPLVKSFGNNYLSLDTKKSCHLVLGDLIVSKRQLNSKDIHHAILHFLGAEDFNRAGLMLIPALQELQSIDILVDHGGLLLLWGSLPLPEQMDLSIRIILRGFQIPLRHKYNLSISYLVRDLDSLLEQASKKEALSIIGAVMNTNKVFSQTDPILANKYFNVALSYLPYAREIGQNLPIPGDRIFADLDELPLEILIWMNIQCLTTIDHLQDWIDTVEKLTDRQRQRAFAHELAEQGCLVITEEIWSNESEKSKEQQNWSAIISAFEDLADRAERLNLELLWACSIRSQIVVLGEYCCKLDAAVAVAEAAITKAKTLDDLRVQFLITECTGQQYLYVNRNNEALPWLSQAIGTEICVYPYSRMKALLGMSLITSEQDRQLAVEFARQAVTLAKNSDNFNPLNLVKALGELAIALWLAGDLASAFIPWDEAEENLLACKANTNSWKEISLVFGHISGYFISLAKTGSPPNKTLSGEQYAVPKRGTFFSYSRAILEYYDKNRDCMIPAQIAKFAKAVGNNEKAAAWALRGINDARETNQNGVLAVLSIDAIPHLLLDNHYAETLDFAVDAGATLVAGDQMIKAGQQKSGFELNVEKILGNKPNEQWRKAEYFAALMGLLPSVLRIGTISTYSSKLAHKQLKEVATICRQISITAVDRHLWILASEFLEQIYSEEVSYDEILRRSNKLDPQNEAVILVIGYISTTLKDDISPDKAILLHLEIAHFLYGDFKKVSDTAYRQIAIPFFLNYWKRILLLKPSIFSFNQLINLTINRVDQFLEAEQIQLILVTIACSLNVKLPSYLRRWIMESAPETVNLFSQI